MDCRLAGNGANVANACDNGALPGTHCYATGTWVCSADKLSQGCNAETCAGNFAYCPKPESAGGCNGVDDDCNGVVDDCVAYAADSCCASVCPACNPTCRTIYYPLPRVKLLRNLPRLAQIIDIPPIHQGFACHRCHKIRFFSRLPAEAWPVIDDLAVDFAAADVDQRH